MLSETQDKALRRISELREQCQLEQKAKAHLEEALRNDLEERDHIINTLNTKVSLLRENKIECMKAVCESTIFSIHSMSLPAFIFPLKAHKLI